MAWYQFSNPDFTNVNETIRKNSTQYVVQCGTVDASENVIAEY